jgi:hypothetical protein
MVRHSHTWRKGLMKPAHKRNASTVHQIEFLALMFYDAIFIWTGHCATIQKVAVLIPDGVIGIFH